MDFIHAVYKYYHFKVFNGQLKLCIEYYNINHPVQQPYLMQVLWCNRTIHEFYCLDIRNDLYHT